MPRELGDGVFLHSVWKPLSPRVNMENEASKACCYSRYWLVRAGDRMHAQFPLQGSLP